MLCNICVKLLVLFVFLGEVQGGLGLAEGYWVLRLGHSWVGDGWQEQGSVQRGEGKILFIYSCLQQEYILFVFNQSFYSFMLFTETVQSLVWEEQRKLQIHVRHAVLRGYEERLGSDQRRESFPSIASNYLIIFCSEMINRVYLSLCFSLGPSTWR